MAPIEGPVSSVVAERVRSILRACHGAPNAEAYAQRLVAALAAEMRSEHAIWLDGPPSHGRVVATAGTSTVELSRLRFLCAETPVLSNDLDGRMGVFSLASQFLMFRNSIQGVLAVANGSVDYTKSDLTVLAETGRDAVAVFESMRLNEELGVTAPLPALAHLTHELRQPLEILEICTWYLAQVLPAGDTKARSQVAQMQRQLDSVDRILQAGYRDYDRGTLPSLAEIGRAEAETSRVRTNSAMSMVT